MQKMANSENHLLLLPEVHTCQYLSWSEQEARPY